MEVTHIEEATKHVVIGGGKNRAFGIANTAEFVTVLSDALYSNKKLAAMREVMCNAWDAHIASGCTDKHITVTFKTNSVVIRDYGTGIADDMIEEIYCIYGESTKRNESNTTGGFGLGSKSPFAISDTFTVTSFYNGTQTVYAVSKGSDETDGLPALRAMVSIPTTQTGLQVEIPILDEDDLSECREYAEKVALLGEMRAKIKWLEHDILTYEPEHLGLKDAEENFMLTSRSMTYSDTRSNYQRIFIQYGAVVYPVTENKAYEQEFKEITARLVHSSRTTQVTLIHDPMLLIRAEPDSLSVNPSREVLSYSGHTIRTLKAHLSEINAKFQEVRPDLIKKNLDAMFDKFIHNNNYKKLDDLVHVMEFCKKISDIRSGTNKTTRIEKLTNMDQIHANFLVGQYRSNEFRMYLVKKAYRHVQSFRESRWNKIAKIFLFGRNVQRYDYYEMRKYLLRDIHRKLGNEYIGLITFMRKSWSGFKVMKANAHDGYVDGVWSDYNPFEVIIAHNKRSVIDYIDDYNKGHQTELEGINLISVPRIKKSLSADLVADTLELIGYRVHRVYSNLKYTPEPAKRATTQKTKRKTGYPLLRECLTNGVLNYGLTEDATRIAKPATYVVVKQRNGQKVLNMFNKDTLKTFLEHFPDTVIVPTENTAFKLSKTGAKSHSQAIEELMTAKFNDPAFINAIAYARGPLIDDSRYYRQLVQIPEIAQEFGLTDPKSVSFAKEEKLLEFLRVFSHYHHDSDFNGKVNTQRHNLTNQLPNKKLIDDREMYLAWIHNIIRQAHELKGPDRDMGLNMIRLALKG